jgi:hypothetical protein
MQVRFSKYCVEGLMQKVVHLMHKIRENNYSSCTSRSSENIWRSGKRMNERRDETQFTTLFFKCFYFGSHDQTRSVLVLCFPAINYKPSSSSALDGLTYFSLGLHRGSFHLTPFRPMHRPTLRFPSCFKPQDDGY